ncbi:hypothetical protein DENSPDRAFT_145779 [Dentipellis sp. KUC8613]|nr:hypothetical protein DENSPDRAFT_145779 [Dentipellis sp. KUC8613]
MRGPSRHLDTTTRTLFCFLLISLRSGSLCAPQHPLTRVRPSSPTAVSPCASRRRGDATRRRADWAAQRIIFLRVRAYRRHQPPASPLPSYFSRICERLASCLSLHTLTAVTHHASRWTNGAHGRLWPPPGHCGFKKHSTRPAPWQKRLDHLGATTEEPSGDRPALNATQFQNLVYERSTASLGPTYRFALMNTYVETL